jgi:ribosome-associated protein
MSYQDKLQGLQADTLYNTPMTGYREITSQEVTFEYYRASGPGGQNVNKVSTAVRLRFDLAAASLPEGVQARLKRLAGNRLTEDDVLIIEASRFRTQERNQQDAIERLNDLVRRAWSPPRKRKPTKPGKAAVERRLEQKKRRGQIKRQRGRDAEW